MVPKKYNKEGRRRRRRRCRRCRRRRRRCTQVSPKKKSRYGISFYQTAVDR